MLVAAAVAIADWMINPSPSPAAEVHSFSGSVSASLIPATFSGAAGPQNRLAGARRTSATWIAQSPGRRSTGEVPGEALSWPSTGSVSGLQESVDTGREGTAVSSFADSGRSDPAEIGLPDGWFDSDGPPLPQPPPPPRMFDAVNVNGITFDDLKFGIEIGEAFQREMLTENILRLNGLKIRIRGYIKPSFKQSGLQKFVFVRDNQECCFGPGAALYDCILVELERDKTTDFSVRPVAVVGQFYLDEFMGPDGNVWAIFRMRNAMVE